MKINKELLKGSTEMLVLSTIAKEDMYGYKIVKDIEVLSSGAFVLNEGSLYPILHKFENDGLVESYWEEYENRKRKYYHIDELYSYGLIQYDRAFIFDNEDFYNTWHSSEYFKDYLITSEENKWNWEAIYKNQIEDVHPPVYYLLLRIANTFNIGKFSIWPGTILNIIIFIFSSIICVVI